MASRIRLKKFQKKVGLPVSGTYNRATRLEIKRARAGKDSQTPKAKQARRTARDNDPAGVTAPLTPKTLRSEVDSAVRQRYGLSEQGLRDQVRVQTVQPSRIDSAYDAYVKALEGAAASSTAAYDRVARDTQGVADRDTAGSDSPEAQQALAARRALLQSGVAAAGQGRASATQTGGERVAAGQLGRAQAQERQRNAGDALSQKLRELEQEKGDYANTLTRDARTAERNNQLQIATLGLNTTKAASDADAKKAQAAATRDAKKQANALSKGNLDERIRHNRETEDATAAAAAKKKGHKGPTHDAKLTASNNLTRARSLLQQSWKVSGRTRSRTEYYDAIVNKGIPADIAKAAVELEFDGGVNNAVRGQIYRRYRIKLPHVSSGTRRQAGSRRTQTLVDTGKGLFTS